MSAVPYADGCFLFSESEKVKLRYRNTEAMEETGENQVNWSSTTVYCSLDVDIDAACTKPGGGKSCRPGRLGFSMLPLPLF